MTDPRAELEGLGPVDADLLPRPANPWCSTFAASGAGRDTCTMDDSPAFPTIDHYTAAHSCPVSTCRADPWKPCNAQRPQSRRWHLARQDKGLHRFRSDRKKAPWDQVPGVLYSTILDGVTRRQYAGVGLAPLPGHEHLCQEGLTMNEPTNPVHPIDAANAVRRQENRAAVDHAVRVALQRDYGLNRVANTDPEDLAPDTLREYREFVQGVISAYLMNVTVLASSPPPGRQSLTGDEGR